MAKSSVDPFDVALANIDAQIADLQRAREILVAARPEYQEDVTAQPKKRGRKRKAGLPAQTDGEEQA